MYQELAATVKSLANGTCCNFIAFTYYFLIYVLISFRSFSFNLKLGDYDIKTMALSSNAHIIKPSSHKNHLSVERDRWTDELIFHII